MGLGLLKKECLWRNQKNSFRNRDIGRVYNRSEHYSSSRDMSECGHSNLFNNSCKTMTVKFLPQSKKLNSVYLELDVILEMIFSNNEISPKEEREVLNEFFKDFTELSENNRKLMIRYLINFEKIDYIYEIMDLYDRSINKQRKKFTYQGMLLGKLLSEKESNNVLFELLE